MPKRLISLIATFLAAAAPAVGQEACMLAALGTAEVAAVRDGRTLLLADGRELRLGGIEVAESSRVALARLAEGRTLRLMRLGTGEDRYGRIVAMALPADGARSLQQMLVAEGEAVVAARAGSPACAEPLLAAEREARAAGRGLWAVPGFGPLAAANTAAISARAGRFALVEGKVLSVNVSGGTIYLNFGRRRITGFSVIIWRRDERRFGAAGVGPRDLEGRHLRVRGLVERRRGPVIVAGAPEQIEIIGAER